MVTSGLMKIAIMKIKMKNSYQKKIFVGIGGSGLLLVLAMSLSLLYVDTGCGQPLALWEKAFSYAFAAPYQPSDQGVCQVKYETYQLAGGYIQKPVQGNKEQSQTFQGYDVYEYLYPASPEKNDDRRKKLYSFNKNGSVAVAGNTVVQGDRTLLFNEYDNATIGLASHNDYAGKKVEDRHFVQMKPRSPDVLLQGNADINETWNPYDKSGLGPSVFFNPNEVEMQMQEQFSLGDTRKDAIIKTTLDSDQADYIWVEYLNNEMLTETPEISSTSGSMNFEVGTGGWGSSDFKLMNATALLRKHPFFYVTDMGNRRVLRFDTDLGQIVTLGKPDWNWNLAGITADDDEYMYMTDRTMGTVIKTDIAGGGWQESYRDVDDYQSRLFLKGSENFKVDKQKDDKALDVLVDDCGYNAHQFRATSTSGSIEIDEETGRPFMQSTEDCAFGGDCFAFNGREVLQTGDNAAWNFKDDFFTIDLWARFDTLNKNMALVSHPDAYLFEWLQAGPQSVLQFAFLNEDYTYQHFKQPWQPEVGKWYHLSIVRNINNELVMYVDGEQLGQPLPITGKLLDGTSGFQVGGYLERKEMVGAIDNVRVARGRTDWSVDYSFRYQFSDPKGIILAPCKPMPKLAPGNSECLYVADSGNGRIVMLTKDFKQWWSFGSEGGGKFQFKNPSDVYFFAGNFYITDTGNGRVIETDMAGMQDHFKGESRGTWSEIYKSDSPGLSGVMVDGEKTVITDAYNGVVIKNKEVIGSKNPWNKLFKFNSPVDVQPGSRGKVFILDGVSNTDFSTHVGDRAMDLYGTSQKEGINTRFNTGGVNVKEKVRAQGVIAKLNEPDWQRWIGDDLGPGVAHCPNICNEGGALNVPECTSYSGLGQEPECPESECIGQWDWELHWPFCRTFEASYEVVRVCDDVSWENNSTTTPATGNNPGDEIDGCTSWHNECYTYCTPVEHDCHEGIAVDYEFLETGPPDWIETGAGIEYLTHGEENNYEPNGECYAGSGFGQPEERNDWYILDGQGE